MNSIEASDFFDKHVQSRFPKWEPADQEMQDWLFWLKGMSEDIALRAIREYKAESRFNAPALSVFRVKAGGFMPPREKIECPDDTVFVMYEGGGPTTRLAGFYMPVIVLPHEQRLIMKAAEKLRKWHEDYCGGIWKVYSETTSQEMNGIRTEIRAKIIDGQD